MKAAMKLPDDVFIRAGYSANADIILDKRTDVLTIPESTVEFSGDSAFVYLVKSEKPQEFDRHFVKIGLSDGIQIEVMEGLKENDKIRGSEIIEQK
jgi:HlyD family secretion protein